jgi:NAD(P)H-dependent flavin oxidoreductase YrpB (nitropropane dioxygenase family)
MATIETALTRLLGIQNPILLAPMGSAAGGKLAAAVTESVDLVRDIPSAHDVMERIVDQAAAVLRGGAAMVKG